MIGALIIGCSFLLARPFPQMASSGQPSNDLPASGVIDLWDTSPEMSRMMSLPGWAELQEVIKQEKLTLWRWLLSHHTSRCCQPRKQGGVVESLKEAGLDRVLGVCESVLDSKTVFQVRVQLDQLFEPDEGNHLPVSGMNPLVYCSTMESLPDLAKENACREIFTFLLAIAPQKVYVAPASMRDIERVRSAAEAFLDGRGVPASGTWAEHYLGNTRRNAKPEPKKLKVPKYAPTSDPKVQAERDEALINGLRAPWKDKPEFIDPGRLPHQLFMAFAEYTPKGGIIFWLLKHPDIFEVQGPAKPGTGPWTFSIKAKGGLPASGAANTVHQADPSLQQSLAQPSQPASSGAAASTTTYDVVGAGGPCQQAQAQPAQPASSGTAASTTTYDVVGAGGPRQQAQAQPQPPWPKDTWQKDAWWGGWWSSTEPSPTSDWASTASPPVSGAASAEQQEQGGPRPRWTQTQWQNSAGWQ